MFFTLDKVTVNLKNVSNVNIIRRQNRVVFNMNYTININRGGPDKFISDYVYWDFPNERALNEGIDELMSVLYIEDNYIRYNDTLINKNEISTIKFEDYKNRVIFNLSHPVSFRDKKDNQNLTSEFVYLNVSPGEYQKIKTDLSKYFC